MHVTADVITARIVIVLALLAFGLVFAAIMAPRTRRVCSLCNGTGEGRNDEGMPMRCPICGGEGTL